MQIFRKVFADEPDRCDIDTLWGMIQGPLPLLQSELDGSKPTCPGYKIAGKCRCKRCKAAFERIEKMARSLFTRKLSLPVNAIVYEV